jgi:hypothetical protein
MSILIYDNATGDNRFGNPGNYVTLGYQPANHVPTAADTVLYGTANYLVHDIPTSDPVIGAAVFAPGANVTFSAAETDQYTFGSLIQPYGSNVTLQVAGYSIGNVLLGPGSHLTIGSGFPDTLDAIGNLWNEGGTLTLSPNNTYQLGGPGFMQTGGITSSETEVHAGINQWINLGNVTQGSILAPLDFTLLNETGATEVGTFTAQGDGGFTPQLPRLPIGVFAGGEHGAGAIDVNTGKLGGHWEQLAFKGASGTIATTAVFDNVVKA